MYGRQPPPNIPSRLFSTSNFEGYTIWTVFDPLPKLFKNSPSSQASGAGPRLPIEEHCITNCQHGRFEIWPKCFRNMLRTAKWPQESLVWQPKCIRFVFTTDHLTKNSNHLPGTEAIRKALIFEKSQFSIHFMKGCNLINCKKIKTDNWLKRKNYYRE